MIATQDVRHKSNSPLVLPSPKEVKDLMDRVCARVAPTWPLDRFIAVNPLWHRTEKPLPIVARDLAAAQGATLLMPRHWYADAWSKGRVGLRHLQEAISRSGAKVSAQALVEVLKTDDLKRPHRLSFGDILDKQGQDLPMTWRAFVLQSASQFCASYFDEGQSQLPPKKDGGLYTSWRRSSLGDRGPEALMSLVGYRSAVASLSDNACESVAIALAELGIPPNEREAYLTTLLLELNGWASWCAYLIWTSRAGADCLRDLLAIRMAWELVLFRSSNEEQKSEWRRAVQMWPAIERMHEGAHTEDWLIQDALEIAYQEELVNKFSSPSPSTRHENISIQAVFCIDVRSEVYRRALEAQDPTVRTSGFAGFFGLPIEVQSLGTTDATPHLPGLLRPRYRVKDVGAKANVTEQKRARLQSEKAWGLFRTGPFSAFAFVDAVGLLYAAKLVLDGGIFGRRSASHRSTTKDDAVPRLVESIDGAPLSDGERCDLLEGILKGMALTQGFARVVLLVGHGSETCNNPHAAGLDCGACCGQTGEVSARVAAALLNDETSRALLNSRGISIPPSTYFLPAIHNTTTEEVLLHESENVPKSHEEDVRTLRKFLTGASVAARRERASLHGLAGATDDALRRAAVKRSQDWAEVRPEWGLARNAAFIAARRSRTSHINLEGRVFLHEYRFEDDQDFSILESIMTAPMVVAHWINFQYYVSTVDNLRYGSGNKVLHNVVGGHIGVFEGNGGDLRIGLPIQSLHNGKEWVHEPLRLSVLLEAPRPAIDAILEKHAKVRELVENRWLNLLQLDDTGEVHVRLAHGWRPVVNRFGE